MHINDKVEVVLTERGADVLNAYLEKDRLRSAGPATFDIWQLFVIFGDAVKPGDADVFEGGEIKLANEPREISTQEMMLNELRKIRALMERDDTRGSRPQPQMQGKPIHINSLYGVMNPPKINLLFHSLGVDSGEGMIVDVYAVGGKNFMTISFPLNADQAARANLLTGTHIRDIPF